MTLASGNLPRGSAGLENCVPAWARSQSARPDRPPIRPAYLPIRRHYNSEVWIKAYVLSFSLTWPMDGFVRAVPSSKSRVGTV